MKYIDNYRSCSRTYATLRIYPKSLHPSVITEMLQIEPTDISIKGGGPRGKFVNGWFLSTKDILNSRDSRRHIDWLIDQIDQSADKIAYLFKNGTKIDICCYWGSKSGNGGPTLSPHQMKRLVKHNIEVWWDVYLEKDDDE